MSITALPALDRTSAEFRANTDVFFGMQLPAFSTQAEAARVEINANTAIVEQAAIDSISVAQDRVQTGLDRTASGLSAAASETSRIAASKLNLGNKSSAPALDNQGATLLAGATYYDTTLAKWRVRTSSNAWGEGLSAVAGVSSLNGLTGDVSLPPTQSLLYENRAILRSQTPVSGELAVVKGLGLFVWESASTEPDDDESAFATTSGVWLLEAVAWDVVSAWQSPDDAVRDEDDEDEPLRFADSFATKILTGSATCAITSVGATANLSFTGRVIGAALGDCAIATPPGNIQADGNAYGLVFYAWVSATDTVNIKLTNTGPNAANVSTVAQAAWNITVIKS
jgi:hypothetical protein